MRNQPFQLTFWRGFVLLLCIAGVFFSVVSADIVPYAGAHPAQEQVRALLPELKNGAAETVLGSYVPSVGATVNLTVVRGENRGVDSAEKMRDWMIYLMLEFGARLDQVADGERVVFSADYYDYEFNVFRQLAINCPAQQTSDLSQCAIWLDGQPFGGIAQ